LGVASERPEILDSKIGDILFSTSNHIFAASIHPG
jgi:hypothetical protein